MKDSRYRIGVIVTALWLIGIAVAAWRGWLGTRPAGMNEWGDFLAGICSPIAFLWLILGYMQQGVELQQNTKALELQLEELRHTVSVGRDQLEEVRRAEAKKERERRSALRPIFSIQQGPAAIGGAGVQQQLALVNDGAIALNVTVQTVGAMMVAGNSHARIPNAGQARINILQEHDIPGLMRIQFEDADGNQGEVVVPFKRHNSGLQFEKVQPLGRAE